MNVDVLDLPSEYSSPTLTAEDPTWHWRGFLWEKIKTCESYEIFPKLKICKGLRNLYLMLMESREESGFWINNGLIVVFALLFIASVLTSIYAIFAEDRKSLKDISNKVRRTTDAIVSILRSFWTLKEVKVSNSKLEAECKRVLKIKLPAYLFDETRIQTLGDGGFVPVATITTTGDEQITEILYTQEEEFPVESDWIPPDEKQSQAKLEAGPLENPESGEVKDEGAGFSESSEDKSYPLAKCPASNKIPSMSNIDTGKMEIKTTRLEIIPEVNLLDRENISPKKKWIGKRRRTPGSGRITIPPYPKEFQIDISKRDQQVSERCVQSKGGIFEHRRQNIERARRTKSFERNSWDSQSDSINDTSESSTKKVVRRKSGIFNRSFHKIPPSSAGSVN